MRVQRVRSVVSISIICIFCSVAVEIPSKYKVNLPLAEWVNSQRRSYKDKKLSADRIECLEGIGFQWVLRAAELFVSWDERYKQLEEYKRENKHTIVPRRYKDNPQLAN